MEHEIITKEVIRMTETKYQKQEDLGKNLMLVLVGKTKQCRDPL